jgi:acetylglutamate kinase
VNNLKRVLRKGAIPIVAIFGVTKQKQIVNVNADEVAAGIAAALKADVLVLKTNTPGVVRAGKTVGRITPFIANRLVKEGIATGGMDVKLRAAATAVEYGVPYARISGIGPKNKGTTIRRRR